MLIVLQNSSRGRKAVAARKWFADNGPPDLQPLPLGYNERERLKRGGAVHILAWYGRSLDSQNYDVLAHPAFHDYACGVMASAHTPDFIRNDEELRRRFPPRPLAWLNNGLVWEPPTHKRRGRSPADRGRSRTSLHMRPMTVQQT